MLCCIFGDVVLYPAADAPALDSHLAARPFGDGPVGPVRCALLTLAMIVGAFALGRGILEHGFMMPSAIGGLGLGVMAGALSLPHNGAEAAYTVAGVLILALGHRLNVLASE